MTRTVKLLVVWILWTRIIAGTSTLLDPHETFDSRQSCESEADLWITQIVGNDRKIERLGQRKLKSSDGSSSLELLCFPETFDPRGPSRQQ